LKHLTRNGGVEAKAFEDRRFEEWQVVGEFDIGHSGRKGFDFGEDTFVM